MASRRKARAAYAAAAAAALLLLAAVTFAQRAGFAGASYAARMEADEALVAREAQLQAQRLSAAWGHASSAGHAQVQGTAATASGSVVTSAEDSILAEIAALQDELRGFRGAVEGNAGAGKANVAAATAAKSEPAEGSFAARVAAEEAALKGSGGSAGNSEGWGALCVRAEATFLRERRVRQRARRMTSRALGCHARKRSSRAGQTSMARYRSRRRFRAVSVRVHEQRSRASGMAGSRWSFWQMPKGGRRRWFTIWMRASAIRKRRAPHLCKTTACSRLQWVSS